MEAEIGVGVTGSDFVCKDITHCECFKLLSMEESGKEMETFFNVPKII